MGAGNDDSSFFLYGVGERPEALTLGSLVLEKYWQPIIARHYTHDPLRYEPRSELGAVSYVVSLAK